MAGDYAQTWPTVQTTPYPVPDKLNNPLEVEVPINGPLPFYLHTSQARHWSFSATQLHDMRVRANAFLPSSRWSSCQSFWFALAGRVYGYDFHETVLFAKLVYAISS